MTTIFVARLGEKIAHTCSISKQGVKSFLDKLWKTAARRIALSSAFLPRSSTGLLPANSATELHRCVFSRLGWLMRLGMAPSAHPVPTPRSTLKYPIPIQGAPYQNH